MCPFWGRLARYICPIQSVDKNRSQKNDRLMNWYLKRVRSITWYWNWTLKSTNVSADTVERLYRYRKVGQAGLFLMYARKWPLLLRVYSVHDLAQYLTPKPPPPHPTLRLICQFWDRPASYSYMPPPPFPTHVFVHSSNGNDMETKANESFDNGAFFDIDTKRTPLIVSKLFWKWCEHIW